MLAFESLTPEALLKEVAEFLRVKAMQSGVEGRILDRKSRLTKAQKERRARYDAADNALRAAALELEGAAIIPANSILRQTPHNHVRNPHGQCYQCGKDMADAYEAMQ